MLFLGCMMVGGLLGKDLGDSLFLPIWSQRPRCLNWECSQYLLGTILHIELDRN